MVPARGHNIPVIALSPTTSRTENSANAVGLWLLCCCAMVFVMVVLGGLTRLTESGLSIVHWQPISGILPPLGEAAWEAAFRDYQASPEFRKVNFWMTLADFKAIYWLEYLHRLWGRLIGGVVIVPFAYFLARRRIDRRLGLKVLGVLLLGLGQGVLGWYMVASGLVDRPDVSQYRLAAHLVLAFVIYGALLWLALDVLRPDATRTARGPLALAWLVLGWTLLTVVFGALVAGLNAGAAYNTFPLMDGRLVPADVLSLEPWPLNFGENVATVQFTHRALAIVLVVLTLAVWHRARTVTRSADLLAGAALVQLGIGIATLLSGAAVPWAAAHQACALVVFTVAVTTAHALSRPAVRA
jgi:cytochrome c oxidase assembly protein subunit 15